jgi:hypothetical protein
MRRHFALIVAGALTSLGASYRTTNFVVEAPTPQLAQQFGQAAEYWRREKALEWLGQEMPPWPEPCPLHVHVTMGGAGGATQFSFDRGHVLGQNMNIEGSLDRLLVSVLPHEVTHTVFAYYFRCPVPRWADEGGAVLSEDDLERGRHDQLCRHILNTPGRAIPLRRLFALQQYPGDVMALYAQGFSVSQFLVSNGGRQNFLAFVANGMTRGWDGAAQSFYRYNSVDELEQAWLAHLRATKRQPVQLAGNTRPAEPDASGQVVIRQTVPPAQPLLGAPAPIVRGQAPSEWDSGDSSGRFASRGRPGYLPDVDPRTQPYAPPAFNSSPAPGDAWQPQGAAPYAPPSVRLGPPQSITPPAPQAPASAPPPSVPYPGYPGGYPR